MMSIMRESETSPWRLFAVFAIAGLVLFCLPFPYYIWSLLSGSLQPEVEWYAGGYSHGPWRWEFPGMYIVLLPLYSLFFGAPAVLIAGLVRAFRRRSHLMALASAILCAAFLGMFYFQATTLFWTID